LAIGRAPHIVAGVQDLLLYKGLAVGLWFAALFIAERLRPAAPLPMVLAGVESQRLGRNLALAGINFILSPLVVLPLTALAAGHALVWRPNWWRGWPGLALDLLLLDGLIYWWHRANHEWPLLWRFHRVHHLDRTLDATTALRFHFGEVLISMVARAGVILSIGFPFASVVTFESLVLIAATFHHSNLRLPPGLELGLSRIVITPAIHWVHHHRRQSDTDSNYGTVFSFWDRVFGTVSRSPRLLGMEIGVQGAEELGLVGLLLRPLRN
jgi:sterol desaturase/sphingolipid hydroxylase (fatty acid hydroxylase superfamily)